MGQAQWEFLNGSNGLIFPAAQAPGTKWFLSLPWRHKNCWEMWNFHRLSWHFFEGFTYDIEIKKQWSLDILQDNLLHEENPSEVIFTYLHNGLHSLRWDGPGDGGAVTFIVIHADFLYHYSGAIPLNKTDTQNAMVWFTKAAWAGFTLKCLSNTFKKKRWKIFILNHNVI